MKSKVVCLLLLMVSFQVEAGGGKKIFETKVVSVKGRAPAADSEDILSRQITVETQPVTLGATMGQNAGYRIMCMGFSAKTAILRIFPKLGLNALTNPRKIFLSFDYEELARLEFSTRAACDEAEKFLESASEENKLRLVVREGAFSLEKLD